MTLAEHRRPVLGPVARESVPVPLALDAGIAAGQLMGFDHLTDDGEHLASWVDARSWWCGADRVPSRTAIRRVAVGPQPI
jgi:hypothetical protein